MNSRERLEEEAQEKDERDDGASPSLCVDAGQTLGKVHMRQFSFYSGRLCRRGDVSMRKKLPAHIKSIAVFALMILLSAALFFFGIRRMGKAYQAADQNTYDKFYQVAFDHAEAQNHVSNYAVISIEGLQEVSRLEVLSVTGSEFVIKNADKG